MSTTTTNFHKETLMLTDPSQDITIGGVTAQIAKLETASRNRLKKLRALLRVLQAEAAEAKGYTGKWLFTLHS